MPRRADENPVEALRPWVEVSGARGLQVSAGILAGISRDVLKCAALLPAFWLRMISFDNKRSVSR